VNNLLNEVLGRRLSAEEYRWLQSKWESVAAAPSSRTFFLAFGSCHRFLTKEALALETDDLAALEQIYPNFSAINWCGDELGRILLMTALPADRNVRLLDELIGTADYREQIAIYRGLYFLDNAADFVARTREGLRTNMTGVFDAIALDNPYPAKYLPRDAWNQMALKAMFMQRPMYRIHRIEDRKNERLARMFLDFADERRAAHRPVSPELWRFVAGFVDDRAVSAAEIALERGTDTESHAAYKVLAESDHPRARAVVRDQKGTLIQHYSWEEIGRDLEHASSQHSN
jgi:hypothetical protein